jgi:uncharacterized membrane protein YfcA
MLLAPLGVWLAQHTPNLFLSYLFILILLYIAWHMWQQNKQDSNTYIKKPDAACVINPATSKLFWTAYCTKRLMMTGSLAGLLSGLLGVGGGFVIVPSLRKVSNFDMQTIIATSLTIVALVSASSVTIYLLQDGIHWKIATPFVISTMIGMFAFRLISHKVPTIISQRGFAILAVIAAILMLISNLS